MARKTNSKVAKAQAAYKQAVKTSKPGEGKRFAAMENLLEAKGAENPEALAAYIGRKKYGPKGFATMAASGRKKANKKAGKKGGK
ncbi:MAG: hypothetical protein AB7U63_17815 [Porticoccaceae bacterium]